MRTGGTVWHCGHEHAGNGAFFRLQVRGVKIEWHSDSGNSGL